MGTKPNNKNPKPFLGRAFRAVFKETLPSSPYGTCKFNKGEGVDLTVWEKDNHYFVQFSSGGRWGEIEFHRAHKYLHCFSEIRNDKTRTGKHIHDKYIRSYNNSMD